MKKFIAFIAIIGMVAISTNIQATCWGDLQYGQVTCSVNTTTSDGGRFYCPWNQSLSVFQHCVWSGNTGYTSYASASCDGDSNTVQTTADSTNSYPYNGGSLTAVYGSVDLYVNTQIGGGAYVDVNW